MLQIIKYESKMLMKYLYFYRLLILEPFDFINILFGMFIFYILYVDNIILIL